MALKVKIDSRAVSAAFKRSPRIFLTQLRIGAKKGLTLIQRTARKNHRFVTRSAELERSVQVESPPDPFSKPGLVFFDLGIALYGPRIHRGFGTWRPDRFLFKAARAKEQDVVNLLTRAIGKAIIKAGFK